MQNNYKCLTALAMLYVTIKIVTLVLIYKIIKIGPFSASASTLIMPIWFIFGDLIAEVYGYKTSRNLIWAAIICQIVFSIICVGLINLDSSSSLIKQEAFEQILGRLPRVALASSFAIISGAFLNAYLISKWKILFKGKYFWLRSICASGIGEFTFTVVAYLIEFFGIMPLPNIIKLLMISYVIKVILNPILAIPALFVANILKMIEGSAIYGESVLNSSIFEKQESKEEIPLPNLVNFSHTTYKRH